MDAVIRAAMAEDAPRVAAIWYAGWLDGHLGNVGDDLVAARPESSFHERAPQRVRDTTVATVEGEVAGFVMVVGDEVEQVYVDGRFRGSGVAAALLAEAEQQVADRGYIEAWLAVVGGNTRARRFYERQGWRDGGEFDHHPEVAAGHDPVVVRCHRYVKLL